MSLASSPSSERLSGSGNMVPLALSLLPLSSSMAEWSVYHFHRTCLLMAPRCLKEYHRWISGPRVLRQIPQSNYTSPFRVHHKIRWKCPNNHKHHLRFNCHYHRSYLHSQKHSRKHHLPKATNKPLCHLHAKCQYFVRTQLLSQQLKGCVHRNFRERATGVNKTSECITSYDFKLLQIYKYKTP